MYYSTFEPQHDKTNKMACALSEDSDQPGHPPSLISFRCPQERKLGSLPTHWAHSEDADQTGQMPRLIWVFAGRTFILLVLSWGYSYTSQHLLSTNILKPYEWFHTNLSFNSLLQTYNAIIPLSTWKRLIELSQILFCQNKQNANP